MKAYKGFHKDMTCKGFQYEVGKEYETDKAKLCECGFHACEAPIDCLSYYAPAESVYHEVELDDVSDEREEDTKRVGKKIKIGAALDFAGLCRAQFEYVKEHTEKENSATGDKSANSATGAWSANSATGDKSANSATGDKSANSATGYGSANSATGYGSANITTGENSSNSGACGCVSVGWGIDNKCKSDVGGYIVLSEWGDFDGNKCPLIGAVMVMIDGETYKPDTWYTLKNGEIVEAQDDE